MDANLVTVNPTGSNSSAASPVLGDGHDIFPPAVIPVPLEDFRKKVLIIYTGMSFIVFIYSFESLQC